MAGAVPRGEAAGLESNILVYMDNRDKWTPSEFAASYAEVIEGLGEITMKGSCHCKAVTFEAKSRHPWASWRCYCSICRKTTGGGGFSINLSSDLPSELTGKEHLSFYHPIMYDDDGKDVGVRSPGERAFCKLCGTQLWNWDPRWPALLHPTAGVIDSELPKPPKMIDFMTKFTPGWVHMPETDGNFERYPDVDLGSFHKKYAKELGAGAGAGAAAGADA